MKLPGPSITDSIGLALLLKALVMGTLVGSIFSATILLHFADKFKSGTLTALAALVFLVGLFLSIFTCREIVERMRQDKAMMFMDAVKHTFYAYLTFLCFLPIIGPPLSRFVQKEKPQNPFTSGET